VAQGDQVPNLLNNLTSTSDNGPRQLNSMSDLLGTTGPTSALANGGGAGGEFDFSPDELRDLINQWTRLRSDLRDDYRIGQALTRVTPPADEDASKAFARKANQSGAAYLRHNQEMQDYVTAYIKKLQDTLDSYTNAEQAGADHARRIQNTLD
jgi:hypothetical protein